VILWKTTCPRKFSLKSANRLLVAKKRYSIWRSSVTRRYSVKTAYRVLKLFSPCSISNGMAIFRRGPGIAASNAGVWSEEIAIFDHYLALSRKRYKIEPFYGRRIGNRIQAFERYRFQRLERRPTPISRVSFRMTEWSWVT